MFLKRLSFGSKECTEELKLECANYLGRIASFGHLGLISDPLIISKFPNETHDPNKTVFFYQNDVQFGDKRYHLRW